MMTSIRNLDLGAGGMVMFVGGCWKGDGSRFVPKFWAAMVLFGSSTFPQKRSEARGESKGRLSGDG